jgi:hypothetical protein
MSEKRSRRWEKFRKRGEVFCVPVAGVLGFGSITFAMSLCVDLFLLHQHVDRFRVISKVVQWMLVGFVWSIAMWHLNESYFRKRSKAILNIEDPNR